MRRLGIALGIALVLLVAFRLAMHPVLESEWFRDLVVDSASRNLGLRISTPDPFRSGLSLIPGIDATSVRIQNAEGASWWLDAEAETLALRIALTPLLIGRLEVLILRVDGGSVRFALSTADDPKEPSTFDIAGLLDALPVATRLENVSLVQGRDSDAGRPLEVGKLTLRRCGRPVVFEGRLGDTPLSIDARLECEGPRHLRLDDLKAKVGETAVEGGLDLSFEARTRVAGTLRTPRLDTAAFGAGNGDEEPANTGTVDAWLDRPLPYSLLDALDLDLTLAVKKLATSETAFDDAGMKAKLESGQLELVANARLKDASFDLKLRARGESGGQLALDAKAKDLPVSQLIGIGEATGTYAVDLDLAGTGDTLRKILAGGEGLLHFAMSEVELPEQMLGPLGKDVIGILASQFRSQQPTRFQCAILRSEFRDGLGTPTVLVVDTPDLILSGGGVIDLRRRRVDLLVKPHPKGARLVPVNTPLYVTGPFADLKVGVDSMEIVKGTGRLLTDTVLDPRKVASVFVDLGADGGDACNLDLAKETASRGHPMVDLTTKAARDVGGWVLGIFGGEKKE
jgi:uncharacterized protein involved in outer membrane biogenesis